jgi:hypothetical protein
MLRIGVFALVVSGVACATRPSAENRLARKEGQHATCKQGERFVRVVNMGVRSVDVITWGYGIQHSPTMLGAIAPGQRAEFVLPDSVYVNTPAADPEATRSSNGPYVGAGVRVEYLCRPFTADSRYQAPQE